MYKLLKYLFLFCLAAIAAIWMLIKHPAVQQKIKQTLDSTVFNMTGFHTEVGRLSFVFPNNLTIDHIQLKDENNALFLETTQLTLTLDLTTILKGDILSAKINVEQAKLYSLPEFLLSKTNPPLFSPDLEVMIHTFDVADSLFNQLPLPLSFGLNSLKLRNIKFHLVANNFDLSGETIAKGYIKQIPLTILAEFNFLSNKIFQADYQAVFNELIPFNGKLHLSPSFALDGTTLHLPSIKIEALESLFGNLNGFEGSLQADCHLSGAFTSPLLEMDLKSESLISKDLILNNTLTQWDCHLSQEKIFGHTTIFSAINGYEIGFIADFNYPFNGLIELSFLECQTPLTTFYGTCILSPQELWGEGELSGSYDDISFFKLKISKNSHFSLFAEGKWKESPLNIQTEGYWNQDNNSWIATFKSFKGIAASFPFRLLNPAQIVKNDKLLSINSFNVSFAEGLINSSLSLHAQENFLSGQILLEGEIAPLLQHLLEHPSSFSGEAQAVVNISGSYAAPQFNGFLNISNGIYEIPDIGVSLKNLSATLEDVGSRLEITRLVADDGKGGKITGTGHFLINQTLHHPFFLELKLEDATLINQDYVQIVCNGPLSFQGNTEKGLLKGALEVSKASITIPDQPLSAISTVDVIYVNIPENTPFPQSQNINQPSWPLVLDIKLMVPSLLTITSKDLDSTWRGEVAVQGTAALPLFFGELKVVQGEYLFNGNPFAIKQGTISFAGDIDKKTSLYVIISKDLDKVKVDVIAKGPVKNPALAFRSNPPLPQREILSWILFNRGTSEISPFQGAQLSESITNLSTNQKGPDVLSKIRSALHIDRLEIGRNSQGDNNSEVNVQVGKYISDNILISVITSDVNRLAIEATLSDKIKLQAQVGDDSQGQLLLKWKRDY